MAWPVVGLLATCCKELGYKLCNELPIVLAWTLSAV
jgi:hypothetical protein